MLTSELLAQVHGTPCKGEDRCHWCGAACERMWVHDEPVRLPFGGVNSSARCPGNKYVCKGCWLYRRKRVCYSYLSKDFLDGQFLGNHSWFLTDSKIWILRKEDYEELWLFLLEPVLRFALSFRTQTIISEIHLVPLNDYSVIKADTELLFAVDNNVLSYTVYELENALEKGPNGSRPGVHALLRILDRPKERKEPQKKEKGRPVGEDGKVTQKIIRTSEQ